MKIETAHAIAKEIYSGIVSVDDFNEGEENECVREIVINEVKRLNSMAKNDNAQALGELLDNPIWKKPRFIRTWGTSTLDNGVPPIQDDTYCLFAGKAKKGKTTFLLDVAIKNAKAGGVVLFYSLEMTTKQIFTRYAMGKAGIGIPEFRTKQFKDGQLEKYRKAYYELSEIEGLIIKGKDPDNNHIYDHLREIRDINPDLCILDNLGLIRHQGKEIETQALVSREIAEFTKQKQIPIILVHHLNKEDKQGRSSIRGTQKLVDDPDLVMLIDRLPIEQCNTESEKKEVHIKVEADRWFDKTGHTFTIWFENETYVDVGQPGFNNLNF